MTTNAAPRSGRFTKRPVTIDAWQIDIDNKPFPGWAIAGFEREDLDWSPDGCGLYINTLEGHMLGANGDWLIKGVQGELYACKPDIFAATYTPAAITTTAAQPPERRLDDIEQYRMQMAGICTASIGYWKAGDSIHPDYDTLALREVAKLYEKYDELFQRNSALVDWVVSRWHDEVANRPLINRSRRPLDDTWRQVLRHLGVDDETRLGPRHDDLLAVAPKAYLKDCDDHGIRPEKEQNHAE